MMTMIEAWHICSFSSCTNKLGRKRCKSPNNKVGNDEGMKKIWTHKVSCCYVIATQKPQTRRSDNKRCSKKINKVLRWREGGCGSSPEYVWYVASCGPKASCQAAEEVPDRVLPNRESFFFFLLPPPRFIFRPLFWLFFTQHLTSKKKKKKSSKVKNKREKELRDTKHFP